MTGDVFQERLGRLLRGNPIVHNIADDELVDGKAEVPHDESTITLLETEEQIQCPLYVMSLFSCPKISSSSMET